MNILAIETSCDETSASVVHEGRLVRSNIIASQATFHAKYGGIVPELASRQHITAILPVLDEALKVAGVNHDEIEALAVTEGPGLAGSLLVGVNVAKSLAYVWKKPLIPVNHLEGHIYSNWLSRDVDSIGPEPEFPAVCLIVSGGHTLLLLLHRHGVYEELGQTLDDAAGEAFDKGARILGLGYPGGPAIERAAEGVTTSIEFPRAWLDNSASFSFSGVKTALLRACEPYEMPDNGSEKRTSTTAQDSLFPTHDPPSYVSEMPVAELAAAYQEAIVDVLVTKTVKAALEHQARSVLIAGGVAANTLLREQLRRNLDIPLFIPTLEFCTDNGAMIAGAAYHILRRGATAGWRLDARARLPLSETLGIQMVTSPSHV